MEEKELKAALESASKDVTAAIEKSNEANKTALESLKNELAELKATDKSEVVSAEIVRIAGELKALKEVGATATEYKSVKKQISDSLVSQKEALQTLKEKKGSDINITIKSATTMGTGNVTAVGTGGLSMLLNDFETGITPVPRSQPFFMDLFNAVGTTGSTVSYAEMKNPDGGAGMTAEGAAKTQADFDLVEAKATVRKITSYIKTSKESLDDIPALAGEINNELLTLVKLKADSQLLSGDNTGQNLNGILTIAQSFTGGSLVSTIPQANNFDVLVAAMVEIQAAEVVSGEPAGFMANVIVMNPIDVAAMRLTKDSDGQYVFPITLPGTTNVLEVPVVSNSRMTVDNFLVMDASKANLRVREGINLNIGYENDDFTKNLVTILAEMRLCIYVKSQHVKAFVTGDFTTAKAALLLV
jgi:HK97 family phage major capsid protein